MDGSGTWILGGVALLLIGGWAVPQAISRITTKPNELDVEVVSLREAEDGGAGWDPIEQFLVTFQIADSGEKRELKVPERLYKTLAPGQRGKLTTRADRFAGFSVL
jgi:hypothetical protein